MTQALALLVIGLQLYIVALTTPNLPPEVRDRAIALSSLATSTATAILNAPPTGTIEQPTQPTNTISVPNSPTQTMTDTQVVDQSAPFERTGTVSAALTGQAHEIPLTGGRIIVATITVQNGTNETIRFSSVGNINSDIFISDNTVKDWIPSFYGTFRNQPLSEDQQGLKPGEASDIQIFLQNTPSGTGSFAMQIDAFEVAGLTTGDRIEVSGFPLNLGTLDVK